MKRYLITLGTLLMTVAPGFSAWHEMTKPSSGPQVILGQYSSGCIGGAGALPLRGEGYWVMRSHRARYFGHNAAIGVVESLGKKLKGEGVVLIGDLSQPRGGPTNYGHRSHQIGLDIDIWYNYLPLERIDNPPADLDEKGEISFLQADLRHLDPKMWGSFQDKLVQYTAMDERVDRLFVHPAIKERFCQIHGGAPWLGKIRPWWGHDDHLHARLSCPADSPRCQKQPPLPKGSGCDDSLTWWFTGEAAEKGKEILRQDREPTPGPPAPAMCSSLLEEK
ncbi:MAG: penicillin-insensitive murein endopeptidase [Magnetococcales bacterium]|nr:penicillin-insensitive murein endopeptidase [Magnetococcales bacterium]NGZ26691.1 penicillin-insensitive murein endopeptidase [Magnetococcales bacterium]